MEIANTLPDYTAHAQQVGVCTIGTEEETFYREYEWCINPLRSVGDFLAFIPVELDRLQSSRVPWQREEHRKNIYLFACAISATIADCLAPAIPNLTRIGAHSGLRRAILDTAYDFLLLGCRIRNRLFQADVASWLSAWNKNVEQICRLLLSGDQTNDNVPDSIAETTRTLTAAKLPPAVLESRASLPFGLREQDLSHQDIVSLASAFLASPVRRPILIVGLRTAGAYFAPLLHECFTQSRSEAVSWTTVRPKNGLSTWEVSAIKGAQQRDAHVVIIDDHPDSGESLALTLTLLRSEGIEFSKITILVPAHPAQRNQSALRGGQPDVGLITLDAEETFRSRSLATDAPSVIREYYLRDGWDHIVIKECNDPVAVQLKDRSSDFHVRLKRLYVVSLSAKHSFTTSRRVLAKDVGYGWLGYHAYLAGTRLQPAVPRVLGLHDGILFTEWVENNERTSVEPPISTISAYVSRRVASLALQEDPCYGTNCYGASSWYFLAKTLRSLYGPYTGHLKTRPLHQALSSYVTPKPTFIDANLKSDEWVYDGEHWFKVDYEHDGLGNPGLNLNVVDPVYDLASAVFEFEMKGEEESQLVTDYIDLTGDSTAPERLILHKLLYGTTNWKAAQRSRGRARSLEECLHSNEREFYARDFLTAHFSHFCGQELRKQFQPRWNSKTFVFDLDGVFDRNLLCFPHPTLASLQSLDLLLSNEYSVVANTGRSIHHARRYCSAYPLAGAVAEHGTVHLDAVNHREVRLVSPKESEQLEVVRDRIGSTDDLFMDPKYECAIHVHAYASQSIASLSANTAQSLLDGCPDLRFFSNATETFILPKSANKASGLEALLNQCGAPVTLTAAIGDSDPDVDLLEFVDHAYAPANHSAGIRRLAANRRCQVMHRPFQRGLLMAVKHLLRRTQGQQKCERKRDYLPNNPLLASLLKAADRSPLERVISALQFWRL